jgi:trehalose-6-phosphate synthase
MEPEELRSFFEKKKLDLIIAADSEPQIHFVEKDKISVFIPAGGVSVALDPIAQLSGGTFIGRGRTKADRQVVDRSNKVRITGSKGSYDLKRVFVKENEYEDYYSGYSNQTLWPLCHVAYERPVFEKSWFENYTKVNEYFAKSIMEEAKQDSFIWIHDYQLALVPSLLKKPKNGTVGMFWHIPWPTWEIYRILPQKTEILESLLSCDFLGFHRGYQVRNFLDTVRRELEVRIDEETSRVYYKKHVTTVKNLPMGIDTDVISSLLDQTPRSTLVGSIVKSFIPSKTENNNSQLDKFFKKYNVVVGIDRLDYTKGLRARLEAIDLFLEKNPQYIEKMVYIGIISPSRENIPSYQWLKNELKKLSRKINLKYVRKGWMPIHLIYHTFTRQDVIKFYQKSKLCLVTPLDDGMNLVSKEFVIASSKEDDPGMLILSQFAGSAIDLTSALIVNPYDTDEVSDAIKKGLEMKKSERKKRIASMAEELEGRNVYNWTQDFIKNALEAAR